MVYILSLAVLTKDNGVAMARKETCVEKIVRLTAERFPSSFSSSFSELLNLSYAPAPPRFGEEVNIEQVVRFVLAKQNELKKSERQKKRQKIGNDARDISYTSELLKPLTSKAVETIRHLKQREIRKQLKNNGYPFSQLSKETREKLLHLPISWVREGAQWQLNTH